VIFLIESGELEFRELVAWQEPPSELGGGVSRVSPGRPGVSNLGAAPAVVAAGPTASFLGTSIAKSFNAALSLRLLGEPTSVTMFDVFGLFNTIASKPTDYGLTNICDACGAVLGCDPNKYLFWDGIHPTSRGHALIADAMLSSVSSVGAIPKPATVFSLVAGLGLMMVVVRRKRV
jgi:outer membrane lipase/esterase